MPDIRVVQLEDRNGNKISPYTAAASVYVNVNGEWANVETAIGSVDIEAIHEAQDAALDSVEEQRVASVTKVQDEGDSYRRDIDSLSGTVKTLDDKVFQLTVEAGLTGDTVNTVYTYSYSVKEYGSAASGVTSVTATRESNRNAKETLYNSTHDPLTSQSFTRSMTWGRDTFETTAEKGTKTGSSKIVRYLCAYGAYGETINMDTIKDASVMSRILTTSASFNCTVNTTADRQYIWIAVPEFISVSKITSAGFDVTMNNYVTIGFGDITYKAYRSKNPLQISTWNLVVS